MPQDENVGVLVCRPECEAGPVVSGCLPEVMRHWRRLRGQHVRTTLVSHSNSLLAPLVGLILCVPQYINHTMSLGEVTHAAAAFAAVQGAFNWLVDNYPRLAEWASSASRVGILLLGLDVLPRHAGAGQYRLTGTSPR
jgi:ABC-type uncharacterized transport system fused permease/ATPase subunit